jgi:pyruvate dehydrogenase complex dehydrogenase (E1) component
MIMPELVNSLWLALPLDLVDLLNNGRMTIYQSNFLNMMVESGHPDYCMMHVLSLIHDIEPNVADTRRVLDVASTVGFDVVDYFLMLLDASAVGDEKVERAISTFTKFFQAQIFIACC